MIKIYGIPNCDQIRKTLAWFADAGIPVEFHDYKKRGIDRETLGRWLAEPDWSRFVNRAGTTWRKLTDEQKAAVTTPAAAIPLLIEQPSLIKRPVVTAGARVHVGFDPKAFQSLADEAGR